MKQLGPKKFFLTKLLLKLIVDLKTIVNRKSMFSRHKKIAPELTASKEVNQKYKPSNIKIS